MTGCADALVSAGFVVDNRELDGTLQKIVGYEPQRSPARLSVPARKAVLMVDALRHLVMQKKVVVNQVRAVLGVWIWGALLRRELLAIPQSIFSFCDRFAGSECDWWPSARREAEWMASMCGAMYADLGAPVADTVFATDAMGESNQDAGGYGIVGTRCFHALVRKCFEGDLAPGYSVVKLDGNTAGLTNPFRAIGRTIPFTKVPDQILDSPWAPLKWGRFSWPEHITIHEAKTVVMLMEALAADVRCHRFRVLSLQDNRPVPGAFAKGRSTAGSLDYVCRQRAALAIAAELSMLPPWTQSKLMPADELSRTCRHDDSKDEYFVIRDLKCTQVHD